jgi:2-oxo-4-hydroxy-4-carboxy-5-ureidoimidazoline decarboxylase
MTIEGVNALPRAELAGRLGFVFEHSPWVAERAWDKRPFASVEALHAALCAAVEGASRLEKLALLRAHPDLGSRAPMSDASAGEQSRAGLAALEAAQRDLLGRYREKFGFPFLYAVKGTTVDDIFAALTIRLESTPEEEFQQGLREVRRIAWFRLQDEFKES